MVQVLVSDTSILIDLERGSLLEAAFRLQYELAVPDALYERELAAHGGPALLRLGLRVEALDPDGASLAQDYFNAHRPISLPDAFALALASTGGHTLLTGDSALRAVAETEAVDVHGLLWLLDRMADEAAASLEQLHAGLSRIATDPAARLPRTEVDRQLRRFGKGKV